MLCGCSLIWYSTSEKINFLLLENHHCLLKLQWEIWWKDYCQCCVDAVNLQLGSWRCNECESCWIYSGVRVLRDSLGSAEEVVVASHMARWVMYDEDLICVSHDLWHVRGRSALRFTYMLRWDSMVVLRSMCYMCLAESNGTVAVKSERLICDFSQGSMVLRRELWDGSDEGCMVFMRGHWLIFMQGVWWLYTGIGQHWCMVHENSWDDLIRSGNSSDGLIPSGNCWDGLIPSENSWDSLIPSENSWNDLISSNTLYGGVWLPI